MEQILPMYLSRSQYSATEMFAYKKNLPKSVGGGFLGSVGAKLLETIPYMLDAHELKWN